MDVLNISHESPWAIMENDHSDVKEKIALKWY